MHGLSEGITSMAHGLTTEARKLRRTQLRRKRDPKTSTLVCEISPPVTAASLVLSKVRLKQCFSGGHADRDHKLLDMEKIETAGQTSSPYAATCGGVISPTVSEEGEQIRPHVCNSD